MARIEKRKRDLEWWREAEESEYMDNSKLTEAYDPSRLVPGYDGRNGPDVKQMYAKKGDSRFDDMGADEGTKTKKGSKDTDVTVKESNKKTIKKVKEADFGNEDDMGDTDDFDTDDVPPEMDLDNDGDMDMDDMGDMGDMEGEDHAEDVADDVHIEIDGKRFRLVPDEEEVEGETEGEDEFDADGFEGGDELEGHDQAPDGLEVGAEDHDVEYPESAHKTKKSMSEKSARVKKLLAMKQYAESQLKELFTGDYVTDKQGLSGLNFKDVRGDPKYAVVARAASGDQYTATDSESPYEPGKDAKGQTGGGKVQKTAAPSKESFKAWLRSQKKIAEEEDAGKTAEDFNLEDDFDNNGLGDDYANKPEEVGAKEDVITKVDTQKANESTAARLDAIRKARMSRRSEGTKGKSDKSGLDESFDYKKLIAGGYSKRLND